MNNKERTLARENIVKILYQKDINQNDITTIISTFVEKRKFDNAYFNDVLKLLDIKMNEIDNFIQKNANITEFVEQGLLFFVNLLQRINELTEHQICSHN